MLAAPTTRSAIPRITRSPPNTVSISATRKVSHQKSISRAHLLPLHLNQVPYLTKDKPYPEARYASTVIPADIVSTHWIVFVLSILFPPMWLVLASGTFDTLLHVPSIETFHGLSQKEQAAYLKIRRIKQVSIALGCTFWTICLAGFIVGLVLS